MSNSSEGITKTTKFHDHIFFGSPKGTHYVNPMRYHGAYIKNTCFH